MGEGVGRAGAHFLVGGTVWSSQLSGLVPNLLR